jgi:PPP family 3-phenylpropionic acid transporter
VTRGWAVALYYLVFFAALGLFWPFFALYLSAAGLTPTQVSRVLAIAPVMGLLAPPLVGLIADTMSARGWLLRGASVATAVVFQGFSIAHGSRPVLYATAAAFALFRAPVVSLVDATAVECARVSGKSYGGLRLWGSFGFLVAVLAGGALLETMGIERVLAVTGLALAIAALSAFALPAASDRPRKDAMGAVAQIALDARSRWFFAAVLLGQIANGIYDSCFSLYLHRAGFGARFIGAAYAVGVGAEIALLACSGRVLRRLGAARLFALSLSTAAVRWLLLSRVTSGAAILLLQPLHGVTFGLYYAAAVTLVREEWGRSAPTSAQGVFAAVSSLGSVVGMILAGPVLERADGAVFAVGGCAAFAACVAAVFSERCARISRS